MTSICHIIITITRIVVKTSDVRLNDKDTAKHTAEATLRLQGIRPILVMNIEIGSRFTAVKRSFV